MQKSDVALVEEIARRIAKEEIRLANLVSHSLTESETGAMDAVIVEPTTGTSVTNVDIDSVTLTNESETTS